jgi:nucleotide-binding universal stress UspA family protein
MLPIRTILHPTDFSVQADTAFRLACALARDYGAKLIVLHVAVPVPAAYGDGIMPMPPLVHNQDEERNSLNLIEAPDPEIQLERRLVVGPAIGEILREARQCKCDLVVMGTHGWTGLSRLLMGSIAEGVLRQAPCPVVTVREPIAGLAFTPKAGAKKADVLETQAV